jgi:protein phosphatase
VQGGPLPRPHSVFGTHSGPLCTDLVRLDCELMPRSAKAQELLIRQYAAVGRAGLAGVSAALQALATAGDRGLDVAELRGRYAGMLADVEGFVAADRRYCWPVSGAI